MPTEITAPETLVKHPDEVLGRTFNFTGDLGDAELLVSITGVVQAGGGGTDLTLGTPTINTEAITDGCNSIAIGKAVQLSVSAGVSVTKYTLTATVVTDLGQTFVLIGHLTVSAT